MKQQKYDLIGDIHGYADKLELLLAELGYAERGGVYAHPERRAVFLGDLVDRGPRILDTVRLVRAMVEAGSASMVMGNHEFNALAWNTPDGNGGHLRPHNEKNLHQHGETVRQAAEPHPAEWADHLEWFSRLPLALDFGDLRAVHASWNADSVARFKDLEQLGPDELARMTKKGTPDRSARDLLVNGHEIELPEGYAFERHDGLQFNAIRTRWWEDWEGKTYRELVFPESEHIPDIPLRPEAIAQGFGPYREEEPPVFFGHYWLDGGRTPEPLAANVACLDYSVAKGGPLTAYRFDGERELSPEKFVQV